MNQKHMTTLTRRKFLGAAAALTAAPLLSRLPAAAFASGSDRIKVGLIGAGGRGVSAMRNCLDADPSVQVWALGDAFADRLETARDNLFNGTPKSRRPLPPVPSGRLAVPPERQFSGLDAYKKVINSGVDLVILATPPQFRPEHMEAAINAGVHVFAEKPVAVDVAGVRRVISVGELAKQKRLAIVAGTQFRYSGHYIETMRRVHDGDIGELVGGQFYYLTNELWHHERKPGWTDMEYQIRNWLYYTWLSGDHIVEQHIHNIDVMNWAFGGPPLRAVGMGGRQTRTDPKFGNIYDHFAVEFEYASGVRVQSMCRQAKGASTRYNNERLVGTKGVARVPGAITGAKPWKFPDDTPNGLVAEHVALINGIRNGNPLNDARRV
ncbi:MAG: Gfo/Idh/MocA family oxidoreductase, partial [Opitutaceae bacterium]|nr:Gfo/Idh/MocA family oxidoreductase [Opitutaceae bacterium]